MKSTTRDTPVGTATDNPDGTVDITIDPEKFKQHCIAQEERVIAELDMLEKMGGTAFLPVEMVREIKKVAQDSLAKMQARPQSPNQQPLQLRYTPKPSRKRSKKKA